LTPYGRRVGLVSDEQWEFFTSKKEAIEKEIERMRKTIIRPSEELNRVLEESGTSPIANPTQLSELIKRPQLDLEKLASFDTCRPFLKKSVAFAAQTEVKYDGYVKKQLAEVKRNEKTEQRAIPESIDYTKIKGIRIEAMQKLEKIRPMTIGQASRISGVSPADISVLLIYLSEKGE
jgi:tRNA uridine 5-carboxymethylaminomethyl modification enzyme